MKNLEIFEAVVDVFCKNDVNNGSAVRILKATEYTLKLNVPVKKEPTPSTPTVDEVKNATRNYYLKEEECKVIAEVYGLFRFHKLTISEALSLVQKVGEYVVTGMSV